MCKPTKLEGLVKRTMLSLNGVLDCTPMIGQKGLGMSAGYPITLLNKEKLFKCSTYV